MKKNENKKIRLQESHVECGGGPAATAAYLLALWGVDTSFSGVVGNDYYGDKIKEEFKRVNVDMSYLETSLDKRTTSSYIIANKSNGTRTIITSKDKIKFNCIKEIKGDYDYILVDGDEDILSYQKIINNKGIKCKLFSNKNAPENGAFFRYKSYPLMNILKKRTPSAREESVTFSFTAWQAAFCSLLILTGQKRRAFSERAWK